MRRPSFFLKALLILVLNFSLGFLALAKEPRTTVDHATVNGYDVYLVDTHHGNSVTVASTVSRGSWHDGQVRAGIHHLWEHVMFEGNEAVPGRGTWNTITAKLGVDNNGFTSSTMVYFYGSMHPDVLPSFFHLFGGMNTRPEWNKATFLAEREVVIDEAKSYMLDDEWALDSAIFIQLLPQGHPLAKYEVGTEAQLRAMTVDDLKRLFYTEYRPGSLKIIVAGNFSSDAGGIKALSKEGILQLIEQNFNPQSPPWVTALPEQSYPFPPLVENSTSANPLRFIELKAGGDKRILKLKFPIPIEFAKTHPAALEILFDYLNLNYRGSLIDIFEKKGWTTEFQVSNETTDHLSIATLSIQLTKSGSKNRYEIARMFFDVLRGIRENGIPTDLLAYLKMRAANFDIKQSIESELAAEYVGHSFVKPMDPMQSFESEIFYGQVTDDQIRQAARAAFPLDSMLGGYVGPEVSSTQLDPVFGREVVRLDDMGLLNSWRQAYAVSSPNTPLFLNIEIPKVDLAFSSEPSTAKDQPARVVVKQPGMQIALEERHLFEKGGISIEFTLPLPTPKSAAALALFVNSFQDRFKGQIDYLESRGVFVDLETTVGELTLTVDGNSLASEQATRWVLERLLRFQPTENEIRNARDTMEQEYLDLQSGFTARVALDAAKRLLHSHDHMDAELLKAGKKLKAADVIRLSLSKMKRADAVAALVGDYTESTAIGLAQYIRTQIPNALTMNQRLARTQALTKIREGLTFWQPLGAAKTDDDLAISRVFEVPAATHKSYPAIYFLEALLKYEVFQKNRNDRNLGYVHNARLVNTKNQSFLLFFGQTEGSEKFPLIADGWKEVLDRFRARSYTEAEFNEFKAGVIRSTSLIPQSIDEEAESMCSDLELTGDPAFHEKLLKGLASLTLEQVYAVVDKYFIHGKTFDVVASKQPPAVVGCEQTLSSRVRAQRRISGYH